MLVTSITTKTNPCEASSLDQMQTKPLTKPSTQLTQVKGERDFFTSAI